MTNWMHKSTRQVAWESAETTTRNSTMSLVWSKAQLGIRGHIATVQHLDIERVCTWVRFHAQDQIT